MEELGGKKGGWSAQVLQFFVKKPQGLTKNEFIET